MKRILLSAALVICAAPLAFAQTDKQTPAPAAAAGAEQALVQVVNDGLAAEEKHDRPALERIIADDFIGTGPGGNTISKRMIVPTDNARPAGGMMMRAQDVQARVFGDAGVVSGRGLPKGNGTDEVRFTLVFIRRQERWQMVAGHISGVPPQP